MSGHSHFSKIKHKKAITDAKRGKIFSKLAREISVAAREKGRNLETNRNYVWSLKKPSNGICPKKMLSGP